MDENSRLIPMTPEISAAMDDLIDARGGILSFFAQVEWFLARIILEASAYREYAMLDLAFSQNAEKRAQRLEEILAVEGPFRAYAPELRPAVAKVMEFVELRNFSAHGVLIHTFGSAGLLLRFRMYRMFKGDALPADGVLDLTLDQYLAAQRELGAAVKSFLTVVRKMFNELGMKNFEPT